ncbi:hypothetical protein BA724_03070 [Domibacillus iocasae]|uniref:Phage portal protein n=2 Tax=Domibacillus iocasae TaxID=1714016 RepID=A0A1E7DS35_9BACI|nr:hypothetical protein BA724_03070 [Domibacillus iocasae]
MLNHLPKVYRDSPDFQEACRVEGKIWDRLDLAIENVLDNTFIDTATWGLSVMENELSIPVDLSKPLDHRRSMLKARKRGSGTLSAKLIKSVAESFQHGSVQVQPIQGQSKFLITFNDVFGVPENLEDMKIALRKILPGHRIVEFQFRYLLIRDVNAMTIAQLESTPLNKFAGGA